MLSKYSCIQQEYSKFNSKQYVCTKVSRETQLNTFGRFQSPRKRTPPPLGEIYFS